MSTPSTPNIDLNPHDLAEVQRILKEYVPHYEVWAFGSRAAWTAKAYSDLDLAIITDKPLSLGTLADLKNAFDESDLSIKVDLVDWATTGEAFREIIKKTALKIAVTTDWVDVPLGHVLSAVVDNRGKTPPVSDSGSHELIEVNAVVGAVKTPDFSVVKKFVTDEIFDTWFRKGHPKVGDVLFSTVGSIAEVAYVKEERGCIAQNLIALRPDKSRLTGEFLFYLLKNPSTKVELLSLDISSVQPSIKVPHLLAKHVKLPPLEEQRAIAHILGTLDNKIELNRRMNETLEAMARALFKSWFVDFEPVRAKAEGRDTCLPKEIADLFPDSFEDSELGEVPKGWRVKTIEDALELIYGKALKSTERADGSVPVYGSGGITGYHNTALVNTSSVIVGRKGTVGSLYWEDAPFFPIDTVFYVKPKAPLTYCYYLLQTLGLEKMNTDAAVPGLNRNNVYRLLFACPSDSALQEFNKIVRSIRDKIRLNTIESRTLAAQRDTLLPKLLTGEVRVNIGQDDV